MDFFAYFKQLSNNDLPQIQLLYGFERYLLDHSVKYIEQNFVNPLYKEMNISLIEDKLDVDYFASLVQTMPFFDVRRLIILSNINLFKNEQDERFLKLLMELPSDIHVIVIEKDVDKRKKLYKFIDKEGIVVNFEKLSQKEFSKWVTKKFKEYRVQIDQHALNYFIEMVNYVNPESSRNLYEVDQFINAMSHLNTKIDTAVIDDYVGIPIENNIFKMMDSLSDNKMKEVLFIFNNLIQNGEAEIKIFFMMSTQFRNIYKCKLLMEAGHSSTSIASKLSLHPFVAKKATHFAKNFTLESLNKILKILEKIDQDLKSSGIRAQLIIEKGILEIYMVKQRGF